MAKNYYYYHGRDAINRVSTEHGRIKPQKRLNDVRKI